MQIDPHIHDAFVISKLQALRRAGEMDQLTRGERSDQPGLVERMLQKVSKRLGLPAREAVSRPKRAFGQTALAASVRERPTTASTPEDTQAGCWATGKKCASSMRKLKREQGVKLFCNCHGQTWIRLVDPASQIMVGGSGGAISLAMGY